MEPLQDLLMLEVNNPSKETNPEKPLTPAPLNSPTKLKIPMKMKEPTIVVMTEVANDTSKKVKEVKGNNKVHELDE